MMPARKLRKDWDPSQEQTTFRDVVWALLWGVFLVVVALLMPASCAHSLTFDDGYNEGWAELNGPQFLLPWSAEDLTTIRRALDHMEEEHLRFGRFDDYQMGRRARFIEKLDTFAGIVLGDDGSVFRWVSLPEINTVGRSVSRDRYCDPKDQDVDDLGILEAGVECYIRNTAAIALYERIAKARHMFPGGVE